MHIVRNISPAKTRKDKKIYQSVLLRESYRENGKVKKRTIANLSHCSKEEINAIELALKYKDKLSVLKSLGTVALEEGLSVGAVLTIHEVGKRLGIDKALGGGIDGKLAFWQVIARVIDQGSRLSAVRLAQLHAACDVIGIRQGFDENRLYENLHWVARNQEAIEDKLFKVRRGDHMPELFLYDVTSSYLEGQLNYFGDYGYTRDGKKGKKQIVVGLLCDESGAPVSTEVFRGNTSDSKTFLGQVNKAVGRFGCDSVTFVGDRGMIRGTQIDALPQLCHYITAITKPQIESLLKTGVFQMELFEDTVCEITAQGVRYVLRRNPQRRQELEQSRLSKQNKALKAIEVKNSYLQEHPKAKTETAVKAILGLIKKLKIDTWLNVEACGRTLCAKINQEALDEASKLDGCYVLKTDLPKEAADAQTVHDRYKDLALVASRKLLDALSISLPFALPHYQVNVVTRKKLTERRKTR